MQKENTKLPKDWSIKIKDYSFPLHPKVGFKYLDAGIYSIGNDFTSEKANDPRYKGISSLKKVWSGVCPNNMDDLNSLTIVDLEFQGKLVGVLVWLKPKQSMMDEMNVDEVPDHPLHNPKRTLPVSHIGSFMCFLKKEYRGQNIIKKALVDYLNPLMLKQAQIAKQEDKLPVILGVDASELILRKYSSIPVVVRQEMREKPTRGFRNQVWDLYNEYLFYDNEDLKQWMVRPKVITKRAKRSSKKKTNILSFR